MAEKGISMRCSGKSRGKIEIKTRYSGWQEVDEATARDFAGWLMEHIVTIPRERRAQYIREHYVRGIEL